MDSSPDGDPSPSIAEPSSVLCQVGRSACQIPRDLLELPDLRSVLSVENWNAMLTEEERLELAQYLPDMDHKTFVTTLQDLLDGKSLHFGSPLASLHTKLKAGDLTPRVEASIRIQKYRYYRSLRIYHDNMVEGLLLARDALAGCEGSTLKEKLAVLKELKSGAPAWNPPPPLEDKIAIPSKDTPHSVKRLKVVGLPPLSSSKISMNGGLCKEKSMKASLQDGFDMNFTPLGSSKNHAHDYIHNINEEYLQYGDYFSKCYAKNPKSHKSGRKHDNLGRYEKMVAGRVFGIQHSLGKNRSLDQTVTIASYGSPGKYCKDPVGWSGRMHSSWQSTVFEEAAAASREQFELEDQRIPGSGLKSGGKAKHSSYLKPKSIKFIPPRRNGYDMDFQYRTNDGKHSKYSRSSNRLLDPSDKAESRSPDSADVPDGPSVATIYRESMIEGYRSGDINSFYVPRRARNFEKWLSSHRSRHDKGDRDIYAAEVDLYSLKGKNKGKKKRKERNVLDQTLLQSNCMPEFGGNQVDAEADLPADVQVKCTVDNRIQSMEAYYSMSDHFQKSMNPNGKVNDIYLDNLDESACFQYGFFEQIDDSSPVKKKERRNGEMEEGSFNAEMLDQVMLEKSTKETEEMPPKKQFSIITPTVHTGFSFSIFHLLSAVRKALVTPSMEEIENNMEWKGKKKAIQAVNNINASNANEQSQKNLPSLTVQEIVYHVRSNPGDPCILETQEPLQDLIRGVLKIFSSKTAPLGAKAWKSLVSYEKENKSWHWVGPISNSSEINFVDEGISSEVWGIPHKMLVKLVDAFANWLKNGQETLKQIGSLPPPPVMPPVLDEKERFKGLRAQKSMITISPSSHEVMMYFRKEEHLRYSIPDRAFQYTALDGKKSTVAPLRQGGGKPTSKVRDHFMLKPDRPPNVTALCLVRDATARLPGRIGTRADVCMLIRDSQYIVEDVTDANINKVASGALDRLHYERDPCVHYDNDRKLWVYLHSDREEEDFEDDGTSSTKKWKRQKKDNMGGSDTGAYDMNAAGEPAPGGSTGYDFSDELNVDAGEKVELIYSDTRPHVDSAEPLFYSASHTRNLVNPDYLGIQGVNSLHGNQNLCQGNTKKVEFEDGVYSRERSIGLFGSLL